MSEFRGVTPPNSVEAEQSVLGAMMQDENAVLQAVEALSTDDFYQPAHREIFEAMVALHHQQRPIDLVTVDAELTRRGTLEGIGGTEYLMRLMSFVPTTANVKAYITLVAEKSTLRKLIKASQEISQECYSQQNPLQETLGHAEKAIFDIVMNRASGESLVHVRDVLYNTYANIEELAKLKGRVSGVPTGFTLLDNMLTGLHGGELIIIGARPSMGKTSFAMNIATHAALYANKSVAVFSLEMPREQIALRMLCSDARVNMQSVRQGTLREEDWIKLAKSIGPMSNSPVYIDDTAGITPTQLRSRCRRLMMDKGLDLIIVDYLGLARRRQDREPSAGGERNQPPAEGDCAGAESAADCLRAALPCIDDARQQAPRAVRPARLRLHRAGRGRRHVHPPRGLLRPRNGGQERGRNHHCEAEKRPVGHGEGRVAERIHDVHGFAALGDGGRERRGCAVLTCCILLCQAVFSFQTVLWHSTRGRSDRPLDSFGSPLLHTCFLSQVI